MRVDILLFASLREQLGDSVALEVPEPATVFTLLRTFGERYPQFRSALPHLNVAVNLEYRAGDQPIPPGAEVALFPPVSGG
jgi:molybdopterin converting factor small subunit